ncbi:MAG: ATP-dependent DNA ligase [Nitrososphaerota archaeon]|jgi:DNA ligase-1|nr:ATP-dependent DNA ligase [Nitrososphaerota archaeon]
MDYVVIADAYGKMEATSKRLEMIDILVDLFRNSSKDVVSIIVYLTQGKLYPDFVGVEIGIAEKLAVKALVRASGVRESEVLADLQRTGDIGQVAEICLANRKQSTFFSKALTVERVYESLDKMAKTSGVGAVDMKTAVFAGLLSDASPKEAKYLMRTVTGNLRLGVADMTVLEALAVAFGGGREARGVIERAYNICSDLGRVSTLLVLEGLDAVRLLQVGVFEPIRPMLAERLSSSEEILEKFGGKCLAEYKYDGERIQVHKQGDRVVLYSRRLENISSQYPDVAVLIRERVGAYEVIFEAECVAVDLETGDMRPFQELMHRRRKYGIEAAVEQYPISLYVFDMLFVDGRDLTCEPLTVRRAVLEGVLERNSQLQIASQKVVGCPKELEGFFEESIAGGCEGLICKSLAKESVYQAGSRGWLWIKYKRDYKSEMTDTVDLVIVGAFHGRGKRAGAYGALLLAAYNRERDVFETVTKCGTGFTDKDIGDVYAILQNHVVPRKHARVLSMMEAEVWFEPCVVLEILGAEVTLSPIHLCAIDSIRKDSGLAIRFPRFTGKYRTDKSPQDATTSKEIAEMYQNQLKQITTS